MREPKCNHIGEYKLDMVLDVYCSYCGKRFGNIEKLIAAKKELNELKKRLLARANLASFDEAM